MNDELGPVGRSSGGRAFARSAASFALAAAVLALAGCGSDSTPAPQTSSSLAPLPTISAPPTVHLVHRPGLGRVVQMIPHSGALAASGASVYMVDEHSHHLVRIDAATGKASLLAAKIGQPVFSLTPAAGVLYANESAEDPNAGKRPISVIAVPAGTLQRTLSVENSYQVAETGGQLWALDEGKDSVDQIDARTGAVRRHVKTDSYPFGVVAAGGSLWVSAHHSDVVDRIDVKTGTAKGSVPTGSEPASLAVGGGAVWCANFGENTVTRIPVDGGSAVTFPVTSSDGVASDLTYADGSLWVVDATIGTVIRIDPASHQIRTAIPVAKMPQGATIRAAGGKIWVSAFGKGTYEIDPQSS